MPRVVYGPGVHGSVVESLQRALVAAKFDTKGIDGLYGGNTTAGVRAFQNANPPLASTGIVDDATWQRLMQSPIPPVAVRSLELTAAFEGHGYSLAQGNWDGAWLTWGIVGFTMSDQEVQKIVLAVEESAPALISSAFGDNAQKLLEVMKDTPRNQEQWANSISNRGRVVEPWLTGFRLLGQSPRVQEIQRQAAYDHYFIPALATAQKFALGSELGLALCFDIHVQNGGIGKDAHSTIDQSVAAARPTDEREKRVIIANAVADNAKSDFREDVRRRKLAIAVGRGTVHGANYLIENWGLSDFAAQGNQ